MTVVAIGMMSYSAEDPVAVELLRHAAVAHNIREYVRAGRLKLTAARIEKGTLTPQDGREFLQQSLLQQQLAA